MPNRILRDWTDSDRVDKLSVDGERFYTRLIMKADDYGRYFADPKRLKAFLFPLKPSIRETDISRWLAECEKAGLLRFYDASDKRYLELWNFGQRLRNMRDTYPKPGILGITPQDADIEARLKLAAICGDRPPESNRIESESETESSTKLDRQRGEKASVKLTPRQKECADRIEAALGDQWVNDAGKWINRIKAGISKMERVVAEVESAIKEARIKTTAAQYAQSIWEEFH